MYWVILFMPVVAMATRSTRYHPRALEFEPCTDEDGQVYPAMSEVPSSDPCQSHCFCIHGGEITCAQMMCAPPPCSDAEYPSDSCCGHCPNGANCHNPHSDEPLGMNVLYDSVDPKKGCGLFCHCTYPGGMAACVNTCDFILPELVLPPTMKRRKKV